MDYLIQIVRIPEGSLAAVAVIGRVLVVNVFPKPVFVLEYAIAVVTFIPVIALLVLQAEPAVVAGPSCTAPSAFDFIGVGVAVVEVLAEAVGIKEPATAFGHGGKGKGGGGGDGGQGWRWWWW